MHRFGYKYDHGMVQLTWKFRVKAKILRKPPIDLSWHCILQCLCNRSAEDKVILIQSRLHHIHACFSNLCNYGSIVILFNIWIFEPGQVDGRFAKYLDLHAKLPCKMHHTVVVFVSKSMNRRDPLYIAVLY